MRYMIHVKDLKGLHRLIKMTRLVPELPNYENFLKTSNKTLPLMTLFLNALLLQNRKENLNNIHFMDSTPVTTCLNRRIFSHKVTKGIAQGENPQKAGFMV